MFRFENMEALKWIWILVAVAIVTFLSDKRVKSILSKQIGGRLAPFLTKSLSQKKRKIKRILEYVTLALMLLAMARPQWGESKQEIKAEGVEMILVVDVSDSMLAEDVKPSRLEQAKAELSRLVDQMPGNKMGVIAFAGSAALISPLTTDPAAIKMYIDSLTTQSVSSQGTSFESALTAAEKAFERGGVESDDSTKVTRVILIASDGEDHEEGAMKAAEALVKKGIRIFTLAYGTEKGGAIPVRDGAGYLKDYKKDHSGQTILTTVKGEALRELAKRGEGSFYFASFGGDHIKNLVKDIEGLEKSQFESSVAVQYEERFQWLLGLAVILGIIELVLGERRSQFRLWRGRFEVPQA
jgi:Ca-activated chloride channel family protein